MTRLPSAASTRSLGSVRVRPASSVPYDVLVHAFDAAREQVHPNGTVTALYPEPSL